MMKCTVEPATRTTNRCHPPLLMNARGRSCAGTSSSGVIPMILTKPPAGIAFTPYSVSPLIRDHSVGPNPTKNWVAFIPKALAVRKWPASCSITEISSATTKASTPSVIMRRRREASSCEFSRPQGLLDQSTCACPGISFCVENIGQCRHVPEPCVDTFPDDPLDSVDDPDERQVPGEERRDRLLVGRVVDRRRGATDRADVSGQPDRGKRLVIERLEGPGARRRPVAGRRRIGNPIGPAQAQRDRQPHVGW